MRTAAPFPLPTVQPSSVVNHARRQEAESDLRSPALSEVLEVRWLDGSGSESTERPSLRKLRKPFFVGEDLMISDEELYWYKAKLEKVVDGDTVDLLVDQGFGHFTKTRFRLLGINTPELKGETLKAGQEARAFLSSILSPASVAGKIRIKSHRDGSDKYGRYLCELHVPLTYNNAGDWKSACFDTNGIWTPLNPVLVKAGHAVPFMEPK